MVPYSCSQIPAQRSRGLSSLPHTAHPLEAAIPSSRTRVAGQMSNPCSSTPGHLRPRFTTRCCRLERSNSAWPHCTVMCLGHVHLPFNS